MWLALLVFGLAACTQLTAGDTSPITTPTPVPGEYGPAETYFVRHDSAGPAFDGTLDSPFTELADAVAAAGQGDIIYVFADASDEHAYGSVTLEPGQKLIGSGVTFAPAGLPAGRAPLIGSETGPAVTLGRDNAVHGFRLQSTTHGVFGTNVGTLELSDLHIEAAGLDGIRLGANGSHVAAIQVERIQTLGSGTTGFHLVVTDAASADLELADSVFEGNAGNAVQLTFQGTGDSMFALDDLRIGTLQSSGIRVFIGGGPQQDVRGRIHNATVTSSLPATAGNGVAVVVEGDATAAVEITGNHLEQFGSFGIDLSARGGRGTLDATLEDNRVVDPAANALAGVRLLAGNGSPDETNVLCVNTQPSLALQGALPTYLQESWRGASIRIHALPSADGATRAQSVLASAIENSASLSAHEPGSFDFQAAGCRLPSF